LYRIAWIIAGNPSVPAVVAPELDGDATILEASDSREAMQLIAEHRDVDLILLDLNLPDRDGLTVLSELRKSHPAISVVVLSVRQDRDSVVKSTRARSGLPKSVTRKVILGAVQLVISGGVYIPPQALPGQEKAPEAPAGMQAASRREVGGSPADRNWMAVR
jgi:DNA-binding NarL/FixJ family response regulator